MAFTVRAAGDAWPGVLMACQLLTTYTVHCTEEQVSFLLTHIYIHTDAGEIWLPSRADSTSSGRPTFTLGKGEAEFFSFLDH